MRKKQSNPTTMSTGPTRREALARLGLGAAAVYSAPVLLSLTDGARADDHKGGEKGKKGGKAEGGEKRRSEGKDENQKKGWAKKGYGKEKDKGKDK